MPFHCVVGGSRTERAAAARALLAASGLSGLDILAPAAWPFTRSILPSPDPVPGSAILIEDLHRAFPTGQTAGTRLVLTQATYHLQRWLDWGGRSTHEVLVVAHASRAALDRVAPEWHRGRGPWGRITLHLLDGDDETGAALDPDLAVPHAAFTLPARERRAVWTASVESQPDNAALHLAVASVCMELGELQPAQDAIERARALADDWEAVFFEYGKLWLRADDLTRAAEQFATAGSLMPSFSAAFSNLGAALAETDRQDEALAALEQALQYDPDNHLTVNNLAVIYREQGRLDDAVTAGHRVLSLAPDFVFGHYNLAHALFLQGQFDAARDAYREGQTRDRQKNPVQAARLAVTLAATGDGQGAADEMMRALSRVSPELRKTICDEADATLEALMTLPQVQPEAIAGLLHVVRKEA